MKIILLFVSLFLSGCAVHSYPKMTGALSYEAIEQIKRNHKAAKPHFNIVGASENEKMETIIDFGPPHVQLIHLNSGQTFNRMLQQSSRYSGYSCTNKCQDIIVKLHYINFIEDFGPFGFNSAKSEIKVSIRINNVETIKYYKIHKGGSDGFTRERGRYTLEMHFIEQTVAKIINDINSLV